MTGNHRVLLGVGVVLAFLVSAPQAARAELPFRSPGAAVRALAMGDSIYALGLGTSSLYFNPACMSQFHQFAIDAGYGYQSPSAAHNLHISMVDSQTNPEFAMGTSYTFTKSSGKVNGVSEGFTIHDVRAGLSTAFGTEGFQFAFGSTFRYLNISGDDLTSPYSESIRAGRAEDSLSVTEDAEHDRRKANPKDMYTFDVGILMTISDLFFIGAVGQNLVTRSRHHAPRILGLGVGLIWDMLDAGVGIEVDFDTRGSIQTSPSLGIEYVAGGIMAIRAGFKWDRVSYPQQYRVSAGLGYISEMFGGDLGYAHDVAHSENWTIEASFRVFLP